MSVAIVEAAKLGSPSPELTKLGVEHIVLERGRIARRDGLWDSFCLVTPNWSVQLPDEGTTTGRTPHGFMPRDEIVSYLESYAADREPPV